MLKLAIKLVAVLAIVAGLSHSPAAKAGVISPSVNGGGCCAGYLRGYWFQTPTDFTIDSIWLNTGSGLSTSFTLQVLKLNAPVPGWPAATTDFVSLGYFTNVNGALNVNYSFSANDYVGLLAFDQRLNLTPYSNQSAQNINGMSVTLTRLLRQSLIANVGVSSEAGGNLGAIGFSYNNTPGNTVTSAGSLALTLLGATLLGFARRRKA